MVTLATRRGQAIAYHHRRRRLSMEEPERGLFGTHRFVEADSGFDTGDYFPDRDAPVTFAVTVRRDGSTAQGIIFEAGDATTGLAIWILANHEDIGFAVGDAGDDGVTVVASNALQVDGQKVQVVVSVVPGSGEARIWINGELLDRDASANMPLPNGWAADSSAGIGEVSGTVTARVPVADRISLTGATIVGPLTGYAHQRPRGFGEGSGTVVTPSAIRITEAGDERITEAGETRITE